MCTKIGIGEVFLNKPDELVIAYDDIVQVVSRWVPCSIGASVHSVVFTSQKAWLIIKPMKKELDVKFYCDSPIESEKLKRTYRTGPKYAHHIRIQHSDQLDDEFFELLRAGFEYSLQ
ncbi:MAG: DUF5655 domain-containing protein [Bacteroidota bacterium]